MGATFQIIFRWGLRFRRWGRRSQLLCRWGLRIFVHSQMGAAFEILFRWGLRFRRWGRRSQLFADGGYGSLFTPRWGRSLKFSDGSNGSLGGGEFHNCNIMRTPSFGSACSHCTFCESIARPNALARGLKARVVAFSESARLASTGTGTVSIFSSVPTRTRIPVHASKSKSSLSL